MSARVHRFQWWKRKIEAEAAFSFTTMEKEIHVKEEYSPPEANPQRCMRSTGTFFPQLGLLLLPSTIGIVHTTPWPQFTNTEVLKYYIWRDLLILPFCFFHALCTLHTTHSSHIGLHYFVSVRTSG